MYMEFDAIIIGGSFAGLEAATYLARALRTVCVIDAGRPRNRFAEHSHGYLSRDGAAPGTILDAARKQLAAYPSVTLIDATASSAASTHDGFAVQTDDGTNYLSRRLVLAYGISDILPDIPGISERWGKTVNHCPYCHGFEFAGGNLGVLHSHEHSIHQARIIREWGPTTFFLNGRSIDASIESDLQAADISIVPDVVERLVGHGVELDGIRMADGRVVPIAALYVAPESRPNSDIGEQLGCAVEQGALGPVLQTDEMQATSVAGVYAAGDITRSMHAITLAAADGMIAGTAAHRSLFMGQ
jgi:thioredoxin reductase